MLKSFLLEGWGLLVAPFRAFSFVALEKFSFVKLDDFVDYEMY